MENRRESRGDRDDEREAVFQKMIEKFRNILDSRVSVDSDSRLID